MEISESKQSVLPGNEENPVSSGGDTGRKRKMAILKMLSPDTFFYSSAKESLGTEDLPVLYEILDELESYESWGNAATAIGFLGENSESYVAITDYIKRPQRFGELPDYDELHKSVLSNLLMNKLLALRWLPFLDGPEGTKTLRNVLSSRNAAESFLENWIEDEIPVGFGDVRRAAMELRVAAAVGLIFHDERGNTPAVYRQLHLTNKQFRGIPDPVEVQVSDDEMNQNGYTAMFQSSLAHALAIADYIERHSTEEYLAASGSYALREEIDHIFDEIVEEYGLYD